MKHTLNLFTIIIAVFFAGLILEGPIEELPASIAPMKESVKILSDIFSVFLIPNSLQKAAVLHSEASIIFPMLFPSNTDNYYISPSGSDSNLGTLVSPWKTFNYSIPKLAPGDTLILLDGTYESSTTGLPEIFCDSGAPNGQPNNPITMKAQNERKAFLKGDGSARPFYIKGCSYWVIEGLHFEHGDFPSISGASFIVYQSDHVTLKRLLGAKSNRYGNNDLVLLGDSHDVLVEENEIYEFHRHGIYTSDAYNNIYRRNYVNSRAYPDIPGADISGAPWTGDEGMSLYPGRDNLIENNIAENVLDGFTIHGTVPGGSDNNRYFGNIGIDTTQAFRADGRYNANNVIQNTQYIDNVAVNTSYGYALSDVKNNKVDRVTIINLVPYQYSSPPSQSYGMILSNKFNSGNQFDISVSNTFVSSNQGNVGFYTDSLYNWSFDYINVFGGVFPAWNPTDSHVTNSMQIDPKLGSCIAWIPSTSPMKGAGKNGTDIGANVLYRYENSVLTNKPLWDPVTGEFPHGAVIAGVNDIPGQSAFDVHKRLNINTNGCLFPSDYGNYSVLRKILDLVYRFLRNELGRDG